MRAIILAAGQGTRLRPLTDSRPKCLVELAGQPMVHWQLEVLSQAGISDVHLVGGYRSETLTDLPVTLHHNARFEHTNMVHTLFCALEAMQGDSDLLIAYGDIVYEPRVLAKVLACDAPVCVAADRAWHDYWLARMDDPLSDAESFRMDDNGRITELGRVPGSVEEVQAQYLGLIKVRKDRVQDFVQFWKGLEPNVSHAGECRDTMYMTTFLQLLINGGWEVKAALTDNGWLEVDEPSDLQLADSTFWRPTSSL